MTTPREVLTLDEAKALIRAADIVQEEKHKLGGSVACAESCGDFDDVRAYRWAADCLQRVEDRLRAAARPTRSSRATV